MSKVLAQAGISLADVYDVEGSIVGVQELEAHEVKAVHELGGQIHSERLQAFVILLTTGPILQTITFDVVAGGIPDSINRVLSVFVFSDVSSRTNFVQVGISGQGVAGEVPMFAWDSGADTEQTTRLSIGGAAAANVIGKRLLGQGTTNFTPQLLMRTGANKLMPDLVMRGASNTFGAGNVTISALVLIARPDEGNPPPGAPSSFGLPIPSW